MHMNLRKLPTVEIVWPVDLYTAENEDREICPCSFCKYKIYFHLVVVDHTIMPHGSAVTENLYDFFSCDANLYSYKDKKH